MGTRRIRREDGEFTLFFRKVSPFSNHHPAEFDCDESINFNETKRFSCTEQYYMYNKASLLKDTRLMSAVLSSNSPREMKSMCSKGNLRGWKESVWNEHKESVMFTGCLNKFRASQPLRYALFLSTGSRLVECSPFDSIWGIGKDLEAAETAPMNSGQNLLGKILDRVREKLWEEEIYRDERDEIEKRIQKDKDYLMKAMKHVDLMYKARASFRYLLAQGHTSEDNQSYLTPEIKKLLPEWAIPPRIENDEMIRATPPQITDFPRSPTRAFTPPREGSRLHGRVSVRGRGEDSKNRDRSRSRRRRSRSPPRKRRKSRSRSRSRSRRHRNRSRSRSRRGRNRSRSRSRVDSSPGFYVRFRPRGPIVYGVRYGRSPSPPGTYGDNQRQVNHYAKRPNRNTVGRPETRRGRSREREPSRRNKSLERLQRRQRRTSRMKWSGSPGEEPEKNGFEESLIPEDPQNIDSEEETRRRYKKMKKLLKKRAREKREAMNQPRSSSASSSD